MKIRTKPKIGRQAFTFVEILIILVVLAVLAAILLPALAKSKSPNLRIRCISNLKQVGIGFRLFANDHNGQYPILNETNEAWSYFQTAGMEFTSPRVLVCPNDPERLDRKVRPVDFALTDSTSNFAHSMHRNAALSYFYGLDADETRPNMFLAGDRNLSTNRRIVTGMLLVTTNASLRWTADIHKDAGNIALADGSAHQVSNERLQEKFRLLPQGSQRLILP